MKTYKAFNLFIAGFAVRLFTSTGFTIGLSVTQSRPNVICPVNYVNVTRKNGMFQKTYRLFVRRVGKWMCEHTYRHQPLSNLDRADVTDYEAIRTTTPGSLRLHFIPRDCSLTADRLETSMSTSPCSAPRSHSCGTVCLTVSNGFITCRTRKKAYPFVLSALHASTVTPLPLVTKKKQHVFFSPHFGKSVFIYYKAKFSSIRRKIQTKNLSFFYYFFSCEQRPQHKCSELYFFFLFNFFPIRPSI